MKYKVDMGDHEFIMETKRKVALNRLKGEVMKYVAKEYGPDIYGVHNIVSIEEVNDEENKG